MLRISNNPTKILLSLLLLSVFTLLVACSQPPVVPVDEHSFSKPKKTIHIAGSGDTLYSIAFLSGLDYKEVAAWNNISDPYLINRGQKISLVKPKNYIQRDNNTDDVIEPITNQTDRIELKQPQQHEQSQPQTQVVKINPQPEPAKSETIKPIITPFNNSWRWPIASMNIVNYKKSEQNRGLDIISHHGVDVKASAAGKVVYAGNGLKGYGNLIIIKHNETYLSAYAHNRSLNVKEGDQIAQGQKIAEVGSSDAHQAKLHFEIRKNGKPISPLGLLPKKVG